MKRLSNLLLLISLGMSLAFCSSPYTKEGKGEVNVIPKPKEVKINDGMYLINKDTRIVADISNEEVMLLLFFSAICYSLQQDLPLRLRTASLPKMPSTLLSTVR
jgi:hypothetical protein